MAADVRHNIYAPHTHTDPMDTKLYVFEPHLIHLCDANFCSLYQCKSKRFPQRVDVVKGPNYV